MFLYLVHGHEKLAKWSTFWHDQLNGNFSALFFFPHLQAVVENCRTCEPGGAHFQLKLEQAFGTKVNDMWIETYSPPFDIRWLPGGEEMEKAIRLALAEREQHKKRERHNERDS